MNRTDLTCSTIPPESGRQERWPCPGLPDFGESVCCRVKQATGVPCCDSWIFGILHPAGAGQSDRRSLFTRESTPKRRASTPRTTRTRIGMTNSRIMRCSPFDSVAPTDRDNTRDENSAGDAVSLLPGCLTPGVARRPLSRDQRSPLGPALVVITYIGNTDLKVPPSATVVAQGTLAAPAMCTVV